MRRGELGKDPPPSHRSSLDRRTDEVVQKAVRDIKGVTVITIAHRLETLKTSDLVMVFTSALALGRDYSSG